MAEICHHGSYCQHAKTRFSQKLSNLELWCLLATYRKLYKGFQRTHYWAHKIQDAWDPPTWKSSWCHFFCWGWSDLDNISQTGAEWHVDCGDMVKIETRCRIPLRQTFGRILWPVIPEPTATLQGAATGRLQRHVIPEPRITLQGAVTWWIHCHDSRATCHIAGCNNSIRHIENRYSPYFILLSASLYFSKRGAYWDRLCRDVVGRWSLVVTRVHCGQTVHPRPIVTMEH